jgi:hypothetical protein
MAGLLGLPGGHAANNLAARPARKKAVPGALLTWMN